MRVTIIAAALLLVACGGGTDPKPAGLLDSRIIQGEEQSMIAGKPVPQAVIDQVFRRKQTVGSIDALWKRLLLPSLAYAQGTVDIIVQPNSPVCQKNPVGFLIAEIPCVTSDGQGHSLFSFITVTKAGTHCAVFQATYGTESTIPDTACVTVGPDVADPNYQVTSQPLACSPAVIADYAVQDKYGNSIPFRILPDGRLTVQDTTTGSVAARTIEYTDAEADGIDHIMELRGVGSLLVGRLRYRVGTGVSTCPGGARGHQIQWSSGGLSATP